ncbi:isopentenyl-diphosphate delta-isomerase ii [Phtheirospermum japonicum]|uniref:Isopentenyl-diphosphate delta-isomerase ii n=1 Tax=Phtheirospermum japonicum TaxID=374723 RepID=A0A830CJ40_9LAMI|nr:isopentenyl-diphosphate delta-isomerase ii [Phtheirospermum japonicum]
MQRKGSCWMNSVYPLMTSRSTSLFRWIVFCTKHHLMESGENMNWTIYYSLCAMLACTQIQTK